MKTHKTIEKIKQNELNHLAKAKHELDNKIVAIEHTHHQHHHGAHHKHHEHQTE